MELRQLSYFVAVTEERNFTRAAQRIPVAQPAISQQIRRLEAELGQRLFVRDRRGVELTDAGQALLPHARAMLAHADSAREAMLALTGLLSGRLGFGFVLPLPDLGLSAVLGAFHRRHPGVDLRLVEDETDALIGAVEAGHLDVALIGLGRYDRPPPGLDRHLVAREPVVVALHPAHPLAERAQVGLDACRDEPMIAFTSASRQRSTLHAACQAAGFEPRVVAETSDPGVVVELVREGIGLAVLPESAVSAAAGVTRVRLVRPSLERRLVLVSRPETCPPAARAFVRLAREHLATPAGDRGHPGRDGLEPGADQEAADADGR